MPAAHAAEVLGMPFQQQISLHVQRGCWRAASSMATSEKRSLLQHE
jgi:hypothetical protein